MSFFSSSKTMDCSSRTPSYRAQNVSKECDTTIPTTKHTSSHRTHSVSSSSSFSSYSSSNFPDDSPSSPATPLRFSGIPFSWEYLPGIPKKSSNKKRDSTLVNVLPLPPPATLQASKRFNFEEIGIRKKISNDSLGRDPFIAALVECSKDDDDRLEESDSNFWNITKVSRSISDRFGFINLYSSCKRTCSVSESIVYIPRSSRTSNYDLITRRQSQ